MARLYLLTLFTFWSWEANAEDIGAQINALIKLEDKVNSEYDRLRRYNSALDCLTGETMSALNLTCFSRGNIGIKVFGSCSKEDGCKVKVSLGKDDDSVAVIDSTAEEDDTGVEELQQCGAFELYSGCRCDRLINMTVEQGSDKGSSISKVELYVKSGDGTWHKIFASEEVSFDEDGEERIKTDDIINNEAFKAAKGGACN